MPFSDRHFTGDYCYLRHPLEKRTREARNEAETDHVPQETGDLDAGFKKGRYKVCLRARACGYACVTQRQREREGEFSVYSVNELPQFFLPVNAIKTLI